MTEVPDGFAPHTRTSPVTAPPLRGRPDLKEFGP